MTRTLHAALPLVAAFCFVPALAFAQGAPGGSSRGWAPVLLGVRFGYDNNSTGSVAGAQVRIPVIPSGYAELVPNGEITFHPGLREYDYALDLVGVSGGRRGGIFAGGGVTWRNTLYDGPGRETKVWGDVVAGVRTGRLGRVPLSAQLELRWVFLRGPVDPRLLTFGVNFPLWGWRGGR